MGSLKGCQNRNRYPLPHPKVNFLYKEKEWDPWRKGSRILQGCCGKWNPFPLQQSQDEFPIGGRGMGWILQGLCGKGYHYVRQCSLPLTKGKKKVMFISSLAKRLLFLCVHEVFFSQNEYLDLVLNIVVKIRMCSQFMFPITTNNLCTNIPLHNLFLVHIGETKHSFTLHRGFEDWSMSIIK